MKRLTLLMVTLLTVLSASAQVNTTGLKSETPQSGNRYYILSDNGYFLTTTGMTVHTDTVAPAAAEWQVFQNTDGSWRIRTSNAAYLSAHGQGMSGGGVLMDANGCNWQIDASKAFREGCYFLYTNVYLEAFEFSADQAISIKGDDGTIFFWPADYSAMDKNNGGNTSDLIFLTSVPEEWKGQGGGEEEKEEEIDVPVNDIEGDFPTNWNKSMQDAKVLTYVPMENTSVYEQNWKPYRKGVASFNYVIFREDVVSQFQGNTIKNIWMMLPPNAAQIEFYIMDPMEKDPEKAVLWSDSYDFTETVEHIMAKEGGLIPVEIEGSFYGYRLNMDLKEPNDSYYKHDQIVGIPCGFELTKNYSNLQVGYTIVYAGDYSDHYVNGRNPQGGLTEGFWYSSTYLLPTSRYYYAFMSGDTDPDWHNGRVEDYTQYTAPMLPQYKWTDYAGLFCFLETEGPGGFPHNDVRFDEVKVSRCFAGDTKVPVNATFTNYGVDPILTATFNVTIGENSKTLRFKNGLKFLEQGSLDGDLVPPTYPTREPMKIEIAKINGKDVNIKSNIDGTIVVVNEQDNVKRMPVVEENTGTWCGWCPRGLVGMEMLRERYGEEIALIGIHTGADQKSNNMMDQVLMTFGATGAPSCVVNRLYTADPYSGTNGHYFGIRYDIDALANLVTEATVSIDRVARTADGHALGVETSTTFNIDCDECPYMLTYVITEDDLKYSAQANYYTTQTDAATKAEYQRNAPELYELTQKPNNWRPVYNDVMEYCAEAMGIEGSLTDAIHYGEAKTHQQLIEIPRYTTGQYLVSNLDNCRLIVLLLDKESLEIVNAAQIRLEDVEVGQNTDLLQGLEGIGTVIADTMAPSATAPAYTLQGRPAQGASRKGDILIQNGHKFLK